MYYLFIQTLLQLKISDQTYSLGAFLGKDPDEVKQNKQEKLEHQVSEVNFSHPSDKHFPCFNMKISLRKLAYVIYSDFSSCKNLKFRWKNCVIFYIFTEAVLMNTHNLCFGAKIRKIGTPLHTPVLLYESGVCGGIHFTDMFS